MTARRTRSLVVIAAGLSMIVGCSDGSSTSTPTTVPVSTSAPVSREMSPGLTFPPGEVGVWQCLDGRTLRLEGDAQWYYEGGPLNPGGADDPEFITEIFRCHGGAITE